MKFRSLLTGALAFSLFAAFNYEGHAATQPATEQNRQSLHLNHLQLIYQSEASNEAPFFAADCVVFESGDNRDDHLTLIPFNGFGMDPTAYSNPKLFHHLENPRSDVPDSNKLVFSAISKNGKKGIYYFNKFNAFDFERQTQPVCLLANEFNNWNPSYHSKLGLLAYVSDAAGAPQIFVWDQKTQKATQLTRLSRAQHPFIDAAGEWIYFTGVDATDNWDIYKIRPSGQDLTRLTNGPEIEKYPTLTRYGKWIVFERGAKTSRSLWVMSTDGKVQKQLSDSRDWASTACVNYSGSKIVFEGVIDGKKGIYTGEIPETFYSGATATEFSPGMDVKKEAVNLSQFGTLTPEQLQKLSQYGFFVSPTDKKQLFYTYEENEYKNIPSFVTADNLLQLLHIIFDTSLRKTEEETLLPRLTKLSAAWLTELGKRKTLVKDAQFITLKRYCLVFYQLLNNKPYPNTLPSDQAIVTAELAKIKAGQWANSAVFPESKFDYSLFKVRGHYTTSAKLQQYFKAMSYLGLMKFETRTPEQRRLIFLGADLLYATPEMAKNLKTVYEITAFFAGESNTPNFEQFSALWREETGELPSYVHYNDQKCQTVIEKLFQKYPIRIQTAYADPSKNKNRVIALMGARYVPDSHLFSILFQQLGPKYLPGGLDVFAALGNPAAEKLNREKNAQVDPKYGQTLETGKALFGTPDPASNSSLFTQWVALLKTYANSEEKGIPAVLGTPHWQKKKLNSALASWTELKHDTILYAEQVAAECGGGDEPPKVYGYIEPELTFYKSLRTTLLAMDQNLKKLQCKGIHGLSEILDLIDFFILVSQKELNHQPLTEQENEQIRIIGGLLESHTITALDANVRWFEITSESAKNMALVADLFEYWGQYQLEGVGYADDLYILIPVNNQLYLMRGSIFSHYEFLHGQRLNDNQWYEMLKSNPLEKRSKWWQQYLDRKKDEIPVPADPYDSGC